MSSNNTSIDMKLSIIVLLTLLFMALKDILRMEKIDTFLQQDLNVSSFVLNEDSTLYKKMR